VRSGRVDEWKPLPRSSPQFRTSSTTPGSSVSTLMFSTRPHSRGAYTRPHSAQREHLLRDPLGFSVTFTGTDAVSEGCDERI